MSQYTNILFAVLPAAYYADSDEEFISEWQSCPPDQKWGAPLVEYNARLQVMHKELIKYCKKLEKGILAERTRANSLDRNLVARETELRELDPEPDQ